MRNTSRPTAAFPCLRTTGTASASECLIGCMMDYGAISYSDIYLSSRSGETKTYGKGIMQRTFASSLFGKPDAIKLTTARILWPLTENCIHGPRRTSRGRRAYRRGKLTTATRKFWRRGTRFLPQNKTTLRRSGPLNGPLRLNFLKI